MKPKFKKKKIKESKLSLELDQWNGFPKLNKVLILLLQFAQFGDIKGIGQLLQDRPQLVLLKDQNKATVLHHAAKFGQSNFINYLLNTSSYNLLSAVDEMNETALHYAAKFNQSEAVEVLLSNGANPTALNHKGFTALHVAASHSSLHALQVLINKNVDVNERCLNGRTALQIAACEDKAEVVDFLIKCGSDVFHSCKEGSKAVHIAAFCSSINVMTYLLAQDHQWKDSNEDLLSSCDSESNQPLHCAILGGCDEIIKICVKYGARLDAQQFNGTTPSHLLCSQGNTKMLKVLHEYQPSKLLQALSIKDKAGQTPLHKAAMFNHHETIEFLAELDVDLNAKDLLSRTPFLLALSRSCWRSALLIARLGADLNVKDHLQQNFFHLLLCAGGDITRIQWSKVHFSDQPLQAMLLELDSNGLSPLHYACQNGNVASVRAALSVGVDIRKKSWCSQSVLHHAAMNGQYDICLCLLENEKGYQLVNERDGDGQTPLHLASMNGYKRIVQLLLNRGANISRNIAGKTPLHIAAEFGHCEIIQTLLEMNPQMLDNEDNQKNTALHIAAYKNYPKVVDLLLSLDAAISNNSNGCSPFTIAIIYKNKESTNVIIQHSRWEEVFQVSTFWRCGFASCPMMLMAKHLPDSCIIAMNRCVITADLDIFDKNYWVEYKLKYLDHPYHKLKHESEKNRILERIRSFLSLNKIMKRLTGQVIESNNLSLMPVITMMVTFKREKCLNHPLVLKYLSYKWEGYGKYIFRLNCVTHAINLVASSWLICFDRNNLAVKRNAPSDYMISFNPEIDSNTTELIRTVAVIIIIIICTLSQLKNILLFFYRGLDFFKDLPNIFDSCLNISELIYAILILCDGKQHWAQLGSFIVFLGWFNILFLIQKSRVGGIYISMFFNVLKTLLVVCLTFFVLLLAFAFAFFVIFRNEPVSFGFKSQILSFYNVITMMIGEIGWKEYYVEGISNENTLLYFNEILLLMLLFIILIPILLINLLIGLAVGDIEAVRQRSEYQYLLKKITYLLSLDRMLPGTFVVKHFRSSIKKFPNRLEKSPTLI